MSYFISRIGALVRFVVVVNVINDSINVTDGGRAYAAVVLPYNEALEAQPKPTGSGQDAGLEERAATVLPAAVCTR